MPTTRSLVIATVLERLGAIRKVDGFETDAGATIRVNENLGDGPDDPQSGIVVFVGDEVPIAQRAGLATMVQLPLTVASLAKAGLENAWQVTEGQIGDAQRAIELDDRHLGGLLSQELAAGPIRAYPREPGTTDVGSTVTYIAIFKRGWGAP